MKLAIFLLALGVCINAASIPVEKIPSVSALLVTELLEVTFHLPSDVAQAIGHIFRDVPIALAKEMIAFVVKVFGDVASGHLDALNQYMDQAIHIFTQVIEHINPKEVAALIVDEVLPAQWAAVIEKLIFSIGRRDLSGYVDDLVDAIIDWGTTAIENVVTSLVTGFFGLFGKRNEKGVIIDAAVEVLITEVTNWAVGLVTGLFGKRATKGEIVDLLVDEFIIKPLTNWAIGLVGGLFGKRSEKGLFASVLTSVIVGVAVNGLTTLIQGKRDLSGYVDDLVDAIIDWGTTAIENVVTSLVTGFFGLFGKRNEKGVIIDAAVETLITEVTNWAVGLVTGLFSGKRNLEKGIWLTIATVAVNLLGKRDLSGYVDDLVDAIIDWGTTAIENVVTSLVTGFFGLFGKRNEKGVIIDAAVEVLITEVTNWAVGLVTGLFGKRDAKGEIVDLLVDEFIIKPLTNWAIGVVGSIFGKRSEKGVVVDVLVNEFIVKPLVGWVGNLFGKRSDEKGIWITVASLAWNLLGKRDLSGYVDDLVDAIIDWGTTAIENVVTSLVTGFFGLFGKRDEKGVVVDVLVNEFIVKPLVGWVGGLLGKRGDEKGIWITVASLAWNLLGKRQAPNGF